MSKGRYTVDLPLDSGQHHEREGRPERHADRHDVFVIDTWRLPRGRRLPRRAAAFPGGGGPGGGGTGQQSNAGSTNNSSSTGATATGIVTTVSSVADTSSGVAKYPVTVSFDADSSEFYVGATVSGDIATETRDNVLQVSSRAVTTANGVSTVTVATNGNDQRADRERTVTTGLTANGQTEITERPPGRREGRRQDPAAGRPEASDRSRRNGQRRRVPAPGGVPTAGRVRRRVVSDPTSVIELTT